MTVPERGSYQLCCNDDGTFTFDLVEDMSQAEEACEDMHFIIQEQGRRIRELESALEYIDRKVKVTRSRGQHHGIPQSD